MSSSVESTSAVGKCTSKRPFGCSNGKKELTQEQRELRCQGLFDEFLQNTDLAEAILTAEDLATPGMRFPL